MPTVKEVIEALLDARTSEECVDLLVNNADVLEEFVKGDEIAETTEAAREGTELRAAAERGLEFARRARHKWHNVFGYLIQAEGIARKHPVPGMEGALERLRTSLLTIRRGHEDTPGSEPEPLNGMSKDEALAWLDNLRQQVEAHRE